MGKIKEIAQRVLETENENHRLIQYLSEIKEIVQNFDIEPKAKADETLKVIIKWQSEG